MPADACLACRRPDYGLIMARARPDLLLPRFAFIMRHAGHAAPAQNRRRPRRAWRKPVLKNIFVCALLVACLCACSGRTGGDDVDADTLNELGNENLKGQGVPQDIDKARAFYEEAASRGSAAAMHNLGNLYFNGQGVERDEERARAYYEQAASLGNVPSQNSLGDMYALGAGVPRDYRKAFGWYEQAAKKDDGYGQAMAGAAYLKGEGVEQDYARARSWLEKAAQKGNQDASFRLGMIYGAGLGTARNYKKARDIFRKLADSGNALGSLGLATLYLSDRKTASRAESILNGPHLNGNFIAQALLGGMYLSGQGVTRNAEKAAQYYDLSCRNGLAFACERLKAVRAGETAGGEESFSTLDAILREVEGRAAQ